jgi:phage/plasmid-like protein (TIGR03299 family)
VVCANTQAAAIRGARASWSIRHTAGAKGQIAQARAALGLTFEYAEAFERQAQRMIAATISIDEFTRLVAQLWPVDPKSKRSQTMGVNRRYQLVRLLRQAPTNENIRGTRWAAYQAITEYADHVAPVADKGNPAAARAERAVTSSSIAQIKTRAVDLLTG